MIPFYLITGFLGSGKTTLLKNILARYSGDKRIAVIQNEFAPAGIDGIELKIIKINDGQITLPSEGIEALTLPDGEIGEITVRGDYVTKEYYNMPEKTIKAKIYDEDTYWHRMGDLGYLDKKGRLWFVGRKAHRIKRNGEEYYSVMVEAHFNQLKGVYRSAMVGIPCKEMGQRMVIVIEANKGQYPCGIKNKKQRMEFLQKFTREKNLPVDAILFKKALPVDIRHNAKIKREVISIWAQKKIKREV